MKFKYVIISLALLSFIVCSCSKSDNGMNTPEIPEVNDDTNKDDDSTPDIPTRSDTVSVKIGYHITETEEPLIKSRAGSSDLIGIQIMQVTNPNIPNQAYACGVFDDIEKLVFKFVKGNKYWILMNYFPDAKNIVYNYPDGTFGSPFSAIYGLQKYTVNEPVYYTGQGTAGNVGNMLTDLMGNGIQTTSNRSQHILGTQTRYLGYSGEIEITDNVVINVPLELCMMGIKLNAGNFTEGKLRLNLNFNDTNFEFKPEDDPSILIQIPGIFDHESVDGLNIRLYYTNLSNETYLLATSSLEYKSAVNHIFTFDLTEREDGSIGIQMPDKGMTDQDSFFD